MSSMETSTNFLANGSENFSVGELIFALQAWVGDGRISLQALTNIIDIDIKDGKVVFHGVHQR